MEIPKYSKLENERKFRVDMAAKAEWQSEPYWLIEDIYFPGTRLRLRSRTDPETGLREFKLCKKYGSDDPASGPIVNIYLTSEEYEVLNRLDGFPIRKKRHRLYYSDKSFFAVDVFLDALDGLVLCEAEACSPEAIAALRFPSWTTMEVTADPFFTGGNLSRLTAAELHKRIA
jgi:CYTH domain-containing protein